MPSEPPSISIPPPSRGPGRTPRNETESRILEAAHLVMAAHGLGGATTKRIAREAGVAEGTIYRYFERKEDLFLEVIWMSPSDFVDVISQLQTQVGSVPVREALTDLATEALSYFRQVIPIGASMFAEPSLLAEYADRLRERQIGPHMPNWVVAAYIRAEQEIGRIGSDVDPDGMAYALLGACFQRAYHAAVFGDTFDDDQRHAIATGIVSSLALGG